MSNSGQSAVTGSITPDYDVVVFNWGGSSYSELQRINQGFGFNPGVISGDGKILCITSKSNHNMKFYSRS